MSTASRTKLRGLGVPSNTSSVVNFPMTMHPRHLQDWAKFVATNDCYELYNRHRDPDDSMLEVVTAFVAVLEAKGIQPFLKPSLFRPARVSGALAIEEYRTLVDKSLGQFMRQRGITQAFNNVAVNLWPDYDYVTSIAAHVPSYVDVYSSVVLKRTGAKVPDLSQALRFRTQHWLSKVAVPKKLLSASDVPALRNAKWPSIQDLPTMPSRWVEVVPDISVARAEGNVLVFRTRIYPKTLLYINQRKVSEFFRLAAKQLSKK